MIMLVHHSETYTCPSPKTKPLSFMFLRRLLPHIHRLQYWELHWKLGRTCTLSFRRAIYNYQHFAFKLVYVNSILKMDTSMYCYVDIMVILTVYFMHTTYNQSSTYHGQWSIFCNRLLPVLSTLQGPFLHERSSSVLHPSYETDH